MKLIAGLGNPGQEYQRTRHNVGFDVIDRIARRWADPPGCPSRARFGRLTVDAMIDDQRTLLLKPTTFMNRSGASIAEAVRFFKLDPARDLLVIVDDIALSCGMIRIRTEGSAGGHNGLSDIERALGDDGYTRCRIGVDAPGRIPQADYVLGRFTEQQQEQIEPALEDAVKAAACWVREGSIETMNKFNRKNSA